MSYEVFYKRLVLLLVAPIILAEYFEKETGEGYGIDLKRKISLLLKIIQNTRRISTLSHPFEHLVMASKIMRVPYSTSGCVVECGCYAGGSTANLSLVCALTGRRLEVFDSFEGLPTVSGEDLEHTILGKSEAVYRQGDYSSELEEVKANVAERGEISVCNFNAGYFDDTLPRFGQECAFVFVDVDLRSSLKTCVKYLWPLLQEGGHFFTHEAQEIEIASLFFDKEWWQKNLEQNSPGLAGAGAGLGLVPAKGAFASELGFTLKEPPRSRAPECDCGTGKSDDT